MNATELLLPNRRSAGAFMCGHCRKIHSSKASAHGCCACRLCGGKLNSDAPIGATVHAKCAAVAREKKLRESQAHDSVHHVGVTAESYEFPLRHGERSVQTAPLIPARGRSVSSEKPPVRQLIEAIPVW